jgi:hypothetical protein
MIGSSSPSEFSSVSNLHIKYATVSGCQPKEEGLYLNKDRTRGILSLKMYNTE